MLIQVDWYRSSGKWSGGGRVEVETLPWEDDSELVQEIADRQEIVVDGFVERADHYMVLSDIPESMADPNYRMTYSRLYTPDELGRIFKKGVR